MENKIKQLRKGILELAILNSLSKRKHYGYSLVRTITEKQHVQINEGTLYPILARLSREDLVHTEWVESSQGPPRKYYTLSTKGLDALEVLNREFNDLVALMMNIQATVKEKKTRKKRTIHMKKETNHES